MGESEARYCKDCGSLFELDEETRNRFLREKTGQPERSLPLRCESCRAEHSKATAKLGRSNFNVGGAKSGCGCFQSFSGSSGDMAYACRSFGGRTGENWPRLARDGVEIRSFNIDGKLASLIGFHDVDEQTLAAVALENAPWINDYEEADLAAIHYLIAESIRRGYNGSFFIKTEIPDSNPDLWELGFEKTKDPQWAFLPAEEAQYLVLEDAGLDEGTIETLFGRAENEKADLAWWAGKLARGQLDSRTFCEIVRAAQNTGLCVIQDYCQGEQLRHPQKDQLERALKGTFGVLKAQEFLSRAVDTKVSLRSEVKVRGRSADLVAKFSKSSWIAVRTFNRSVYWKKITIRKGGRAAFEVKAWGEGSYSRGNLERACKQVRALSRSFPHAFLAVTREFNNLSAVKQQQVIKSVCKSGGEGVLVLEKASARGIGRDIDRFFDTLGRV